MLVGPGYTWRSERFVLTGTPDQPTSVVIAIPHDTLDYGYNDLFKGLIPYRPFGQPDGDQWTSIIAMSIAANAPVYIVRGLVPRPIIDYNRRPSEAYARDADPTIRAAYRAYHRAINRAVQEIRANGRNPLVIDLHGTSDQPAYGTFDAMFGSFNRRTVWSNVDQVFGALLAGCKDRHGRYNRVFVPQETTAIPNTPDFAAGEYTIWRLARMGPKARRCEAFQIETVKRFRNPRNRRDGLKFGRDIAYAVRVINRTR